MPIYKAPLDDIRFAQHELLSELLGTDLPENEALSVEVVDAVLEEAGRVCEQVLLPLNQIGDQQGCRYENGTVSTPDGFKSAYAQFAAGGWTSMAADPEYGGQGLPHHLNVAIEEMMCSANLAFSMYPGLSMGAYRAIRRWGDEDQKQIYLPKLTDGSWSGTMCLTEPHCGTDLGLLRTRAVPMDDGSYAITGTKIFISAGEHDLTDNIVHLVLARTPDAPSGTRGISLFVVPKFLPVSGPDGIGSGQRNGVRCSAIEHKMGINGSATCVLDFDAATGYLVGELHRGMRAMFTMMNAARLGVGVQGLGITEIAYQNAVDYARQRLQGKALDDRADDPERAEAEADPIIRHPDVRRMLLRMRACAEGGRALCTWVSAELDIAERHPDPLVRAAADDLVSLLTPVVKALLTDHGSEVANLALQIHGGHGYIRAQGIEQFVRDARICQIYEGTNGVQALD
ncbi:MAG: acyl-CoA dehydrogenase family protein, partial [Gammaproteobacteria bacterium]|nr:acyl-CoA dehydrogenase family protein [Gammaproteobacteria bacterium]